MKPRLILLALLVAVPSQFTRAADEPARKSPVELFAGGLQKIINLIEPAPDAPAQTFTARIEFHKTTGLPKDVKKATGELGFQAPDHLRLSVKVGDRNYTLGRNGQQLWVYVPDKEFGVIGEPGRPRFASAPEKKDTTKLAPLGLPVPREQLALLPLLTKVEALPDDVVNDAGCHVLRVTPKPEALQALKIPNGSIKLWLRTNDLLPARLGYADGKEVDVEVDFREARFVEPWPADQWKLPAKKGDDITTTALSHLTKFATVALSSLNQKIPSLGPATGERKVVAIEGKGRLERIDGTRVLFVSGTPAEMGHQHGKLLKKEIRDLVDRILYGVGVGSSFEKGRWFFSEIESAQARLAPFMDARYLEEMDAIAQAAGLEKEETRLANFFPELFHCSGFAVFGAATVGGKMYHGRVLDYLKGMGLEQNAVVIVFQPDQGNAWVNVSYAGFVGSVTAMNAKQIAIGEMGGRGEGQWDGKPMAQLLREVMEKADNLDQAIAIMRESPRTCEYYYVISDAKAKKAVGIAATPKKFEMVWPGENHPQLPHGIKDTVLMSAGDRYKKLVSRVEDGYGTLDPESARDLMCRPVAMNSNIHCALFAPDTLEFWVANADSKDVASQSRYTHYNLAELLKGPPVGAGAAATPVK